MEAKHSIAWQDVHVNHRRYDGFSGTINVARKPLGLGIHAHPKCYGHGASRHWCVLVVRRILRRWQPGCFMLFNSGNATGSTNDGHILAFDPPAGNWFYSRKGRAPGYGSGSTHHSSHGIQGEAKRGCPRWRQRRAQEAVAPERRTAISTA